MKEAILRGDLNGYADILGRSWVAKKKIAKGISNPMIDELYAAAIQAGARAGKISGAGGGGFMMFFVSPSKRMDVIRALSVFSGKLMNFHFTNQGATSWVIG